MAKISRAQGPSMTTDEFEAHDNIQPNVKIRRPELVPMRLVKRTEEPKSVGTKSSRSTGDSRSPDSKGTNNPSGHVPVTENPSGVEVSSDANSVVGAPTQTQSQPSGRRKPAKKAAPKAPAGAEDETVADPDRAGVRFTDDDF